MQPATTDEVFDLLDGYVTSAALNAALDTGLFWLLAGGPMDLEEIGRTLDIPKGRCRQWLQVLGSSGLVEESPGGYCPSAVAQTAILDSYSHETWAFLAREARDRYPAVNDIARNIHRPGSVWEAQGLEPPDYFLQMVDDPDRAHQFTRMLYELHLPLADKLAASLDLSAVARLMDLGGGSGVMSLALLRRNPQLTAVVVDIPNVCAAGREIARENSLEDRITYHGADFLRDDLPSCFDLVLQCDAGPYTVALLHKIRDSLNDGGRLVIVGQLAQTEGVALPPRVIGAFLSSLQNPNYTPLTLAQVKSRLREAGYRPLSERILPHDGAPFWSSYWTVLEAFL